MHFISTRRSWLNPVERFLRAMADERIRRARVVLDTV
jgi:hypothetical protein